MVAVASRTMTYPELSVAPRTVKFHMDSARTKMCAANRQEAVASPSRPGCSTSCPEGAAGQDDRYSTSARYACHARGRSPHGDDEAANQSRNPAPITSAINAAQIAIGSRFSRHARRLVSAATIRRCCGRASSARTRPRSRRPARREAANGEVGEQNSMFLGDRAFAMNPCSDGISSGNDTAMTTSEARDHTRSSTPSTRANMPIEPTFGRQMSIVAPGSAPPALALPRQFVDAGREQRSDEQEASREPHTYS